METVGRIALVAAATAALAAGCSNEPAVIARDDGPGPPPENAQRTAATAHPLPGGVTGFLALSTGTVTGGMVGGRPCLWLTHDDQSVSAAVWGPGYQVDDDYNLLDARGQVLARIGDDVLGGGGVVAGVTEKARTCAPDGAGRTVFIDNVTVSPGT